MLSRRGCGTDYIDITADADFFCRVEQLRTAESSVLLSIGLATGVTNIPAAKCAAAMDSAEEVEIGSLGSVGDRHGKAGIEWLVEHRLRPWIPGLQGTSLWPREHPTCTSSGLLGPARPLRSLEGSVATGVRLNSRFLTDALFRAAVLARRKPAVKRAHRETLQVSRSGPTLSRGS